MTGKANRYLLEKTKALAISDLINRVLWVSYSVVTLFIVI